MTEEVAAIVREAIADLEHATHYYITFGPGSTGWDNSWETESAVMTDAMRAEIARMLAAELEDAVNGTSGSVDAPTCGCVGCSADEMAADVAVAERHIGVGCTDKVMLAP